jgi:hypothetical protein
VDTWKKAAPKSEQMGNSSHDVSDLLLHRCLPRCTHNHSDHSLKASNWKWVARDFRV